MTTLTSVKFILKLKTQILLLKIYELDSKQWFSIYFLLVGILVKKKVSYDKNNCLKKTLSKKCGERIKAKNNIYIFKRTKNAFLSWQYKYNSLVLSVQVIKLYIER